MDSRKWRPMTDEAPTGEGVAIAREPEGSVRIRAAAAGEMRQLTERVRVRAAEFEVTLDEDARKRFLAMARALLEGLPAVDDQCGAVRLYDCGKLTLRLPDGTVAQAPASAVFEVSDRAQLQLLWTAQLTDGSGRSLSVVSEGAFDVAEFVGKLAHEPPVRTTDHPHRALQAHVPQVAAWLRHLSSERMAYAAAMLMAGAGFGAASGTTPESAFAGAAIALLAAVCMRRA